MDQRRAADLFERHQLALFRYVYRQTRRREVAEDVVQEVFVRVMRNLETYHERGREIAWLNAYHAQVRELVGPKVDAATRAWLEAATAAI